MTGEADHIRLSQGIGDFNFDLFAIATKPRTVANGFIHSPQILSFLGSYRIFRGRILGTRLLKARFIGCDVLSMFEIDAKTLFFLLASSLSKVVNLLFLYVSTSID